MVAARSVTVKLKLDASDFNRGLAAAAARAKAFQKILDDGGGNTIFSSTADDVTHLSRSVDDLDTSTKSLNKTLGDGNNNAKNFGKGIAASNSHLALMVQYGVALGPALVPALAAAVPLAAALGSGLTFAAVGAGTAVLAFQGVGDALKAMNDYAIDPTEAHLKKLNETMDTLGPAGQDFVVFLNDLRPAIQNLQNIAQEGMFPGIQEGIEQVLTQMPLIEEVIASVSTAMGQLAADTGEALTSPFWTDFFEYIRDDASTIIRDFSVGFGKMFEGIAALVLDFAPLTNDIAAGFANMGRSFSAWAQNLPATEGFQDFIAYLRETGPQILSTLGNLGTALLDIGVALSGMPAQTSLLILNGLALALSAIAASPIGPGLLAAAVGISALTRAIGLWDTVQASAMMQFFGARGAATAGKPGMVGGIARGIQSFPISQMGAIAGGIVLISDAMGGFSEKAGLSNTVTFGAIGALFGLPGAAVGAGVGLWQDMSHVADDFNDSLDRLNATMEATPANLGDINAALSASKEELRSFKDDVTADTWGEAFTNLGDIDQWKNTLDGLIGDDVVDKMQKATDAQVANVERFKTTIASLKNQFDDNFLTREFDDSTLQEFMDKNQLALEHFKVTWQDLDQLSRQKQMGGILGGAAQAQWDATTKALEHYSETALTTEGKSRAVGEALAALGAEAGNSQAEIDALSTALDNLFSPALDYSRAMDEWRQGLRHLAEDLKGSSLDPNTDVGAANREVIRQQVEQMLEVLNTAAATGEIGGRQLINRLQAMREQMIQVGKEAGLQGPKLREFLATLNLTPKQIRIAVHAAGVEKARQDAKNLADDIKKIPKDVKTDIAANGVPANATVKSLMAKYEGLTKYQAKTILRAINEADPTIAAVLKHLKGLERDFLARVRVDTGSSMGQILGVKLGLDSIDGRTAVAYTEVRNRTINTVLDRHLTSNNADGGLIRGPGGPRSDVIPAMLSNGEFVVNAAATKQNLALLHSINAKKFADGGQAGRQISASEIGRRSVNPNLDFMRDLERALRRMRDEARQVEKAEDRVTRAKHLSRLASERLEQAQKNEHASKERLRRLQQDVTQATKHQTYEEKQLSKQREELSKATAKWKDVQAQLLSQAQAISSAITSQGAIFGGQGTSTTVGGILAKLRTSANDAKKFRGYIAKLRGMGLDERIIQQLLEQGPTPEGLAAARNLAHASEKEIKQITRQEQRLVGVAASTGALGIRHGNTQIVNIRINKVETTDIKRLERQLPKRIGRAVRVARSRS